MTKYDTPTQIGVYAGGFTLFRCDARWGTQLTLVRDETLEEIGKVEVWRPEPDHSFGPKAAEVNWQALGSKSARIATLYAEMLTMAARLAEEMDEQVQA